MHGMEASSYIQSVVSGAHPHVADGTFEELAYMTKPLYSLFQLDRYMELPLYLNPDDHSNLLVSRRAERVCAVQIEADVNMV